MKSLLKKSSVFFLLMLGVLGSAFLFSSCGKPSGDDKTITVWHWMTDRHEAFEAMAKQYEELTGIPVKFDLYAPPDAYTQRIIASAQAKTLPDIYGILDKKQIFADFIKYGFVADLTAAFEADGGQWKNSFVEKALAVNRFLPDNVHDVPAGIYGVPIDITNIQMLYNKKLLNKAGITKVPESFEEFLSAAEALNRVGISGLVSGWGETWLADCFASNYAFNIMGEEKVMATYRGEVSYTDPDWIKVFNVFKRLSESNALMEGIVTKPNKDAEQDFALERAAFTFNGSWCVNVYNGINPDLEYGAMMPPYVNPSRPMKIWGGAGSSLVVNNASPRNQQAIDFLKWFSAKEQQIKLAQETRNLPANKEALSEIPDILSEFARMMDQTTHPTIWEHNEIPIVIETFDKGLQSIIIGEKTPEQVATEVQAVKDREMTRMKNRK